MTKIFKFCANGIKFRLEVKEHGFVLWDAQNHQGQWLIDGSTLGQNGEVRISSGEFNYQNSNVEVTNDEGQHVVTFTATTRR